MSDPYFRYLDTGGDGTGTKDMAVNGAITAVPHMLIPASGEVYTVERMIIYIEDNVAIDATNYGGISALTNGITLKILKQSDDSVVQDLLDGLPIKKNGHWARMCYDVVAGAYGNADDYLSVRWTFSKAGAPLVLTDENYLSLQVNDDLSALFGHFAMVQGLA